MRWGVPSFGWRMIRKGLTGLLTSQPILTQQLAVRSGLVVKMWQPERQPGPPILVGNQVWTTEIAVPPDVQLRPVVGAWYMLWGGCMVSAVRGGAWYVLWGGA